MKRYLPHKQLADFKRMDSMLNLMAMLQPYKAKEIRQAQKTLAEVGRLLIRTNAAFWSVVISAIGQATYYTIDHHNGLRAAAFVCPAMVIAMMYSIKTGKELDKKRELFEQQWQIAQQKNR